MSELYAAGTDPYCYPGSSVLRNRFDIHDGRLLADVEALYSQQRLAELASPVTRDTTLTPLQRLSDFFTLFRNHFAQEGFVKGCPIGNLIQELGDVNDAFRTKLQAPMENLIHFVARQLHKAQKRGELSEKLPAADTARFIISAWQGALLQMKVCAGPEPLDNFHQMVFNILLT